MKKIILLCLSLTLISCGKKQWVTDLTYETVDQDDQKWIVTDFKVDLGDNVLPEIIQPLPRDYGNFRSKHVEGENFLGLDLNLSTILGLPGGVATLPNGQVVPIDTRGSGVIEIPFPQINGKAYVSLNNDMTLVGVATVIKQLDGLDLGDVGVFPVFNVSGIDIMAGVFTSEDKEQSGLAIFANFGSLWNKSFEYDSGAFIYDPEYVSKSKRRKFYRQIRKLMKQNHNLEFGVY